MKKVEMYTDGACRGNPGPGGWGVLVRNGENERTLYGGELETTNNRMELTAAIEGLTMLSEPCRVELTTDSEYVRRGITEWMQTWKQRNWRTAARKPVANRDLWERLDAIANVHDVRWHWVRGHSGHADNERVDALANQAIDEMQKENR